MSCLVGNMIYPYKTKCIHCGDEFMIDTDHPHKCKPSDLYSVMEETIDMDVMPMNDPNKDIYITRQTTSDPIVNAVINKYAKRSALGMNKYNTTMKDNPKGLIFWLESIQEELMDASLYIERTMDELKKLMGEG